MKRLICFVLVIILSTSLISCSSQTEDDFLYKDGYLMLNEVPKHSDISKFTMSSSMFSSSRANIDNESDGVRILSAIGNVKAEKFEWGEAIKTNDIVQQIFARGLQINYSIFSLFIGTDGTVIARTEEHAYITQSNVVDYNNMKSLCEEIAKSSNQLYS